MENIEIYIEKEKNKLGELIYIPYNKNKCNAQEYFESFNFIKEFLIKEELVLMEDNYCLHYRKRNKWRIEGFYLNITLENKLFGIVEDCLSSGYYCKGEFRDIEINDFIKEYYKILNNDVKMI